MKKTAFSKSGFYIIPEVLNKEQVEQLRNAVQQFIETNQTKNYGIRRLLELIPEVRTLMASPPIRTIVESILGREAFPVRGIFFDKNPKANWGVPWHQDLTIAVGDRIQTPGFAPWSRKDGIDCVQPPSSLLERMVTLRVYLDDADEENGSLRVIPGSHRWGRLSEEAIKEWKPFAVNCSVPSGGVLVMKPLILHSSSPAKTPVHRRVFHLEFAAEALPNGLQWYGT